MAHNRDMAKTPAMTYNENFGEVSVGQLRAYKRFNVSPSDHTQLVDFFGETAYAAITKYVNDNAGRNGGMFQVYYLGKD